MIRGWRLRDFAVGDGLARGAHKDAADDAGWLPVDVPGDVHRTLIAAGRIPDPFYDQNETACTWMEEREWWYRATFAAPDPPLRPDERLQLVFDGLDTFATAWLNGQELGRHSNMFRPAVFSVRELQPTNSLAVCFHPPLQQVGEVPTGRWRMEPRSLMRKAQFGYGWDWGPRLPTIGIWRPVRLVRQRQAALAGVHVTTIDLSPGQARAALAVRVEIQRFATSEPASARLRVTDPDGQVVLDHALAIHDGDAEATAYLTLEQPRLWWTHDLGESALYSLEVTLEPGGDTRTVPFGVRTIALDQSPDPDEPATRFFRFILNGVPVFARGANWIPCDAFVGAIEPAHYTRLIVAARDANMTMLRVWGGGIYEHDAFYAECDRLGLLVWQDFMFACASYPDDDPAFVAQVEAEARYQVRRLRNHPSLALWCGNNENQWLAERAMWDRTELPPYGALLYDNVLPTVVAELDGRTPYWPGSPYGGSDHNSPLEGDVHNWEAWHGNYPRQFGEQPRREFTPASVSFVRYGDDLGRFVSEFGLHAAPQMETLRRVIPDDQLWHHSRSLDWHNKDNPKNKGDNLMLGSTGLPRDLAEYVVLSQLAQAEGLKFGVEHFRRRKPHCSGTLVWQLDDCWPVLSWSVIDYYGVPKASYYALRRAYAPLLASFKPLADGGAELWLTNDTLSSFEDTAQVRLARFDGTLEWSRECPLQVGANTSVPVARFDASDAAHYLWVSSAAGRFYPNRYFFAAIKDLLRPAASVTMSVSDQVVRVRAAADAYALFVHVLSPDPSVRLSDNFFDLQPGEERAIALSQTVQPGSLRLAWR